MAINLCDYSYVCFTGSNFNNYLQPLLFLATPTSCALLLCTTKDVKSYRFQMKFEVLSLNFDQLQDYWRLSSGLHFQYLLVLFVPIWESHKKHEIRLSKCILDSSLKFNTPSPDQIHRIQESVCICKVLVAGQDAVENYVVENLRVHDLPCVVMYSGDGVPLFFEDKRNMFQLNPFYSQMINMVSSSATIITRLKNSLRSADIIPALFCAKESEEASSYESTLRVFVAGSRSTAGKTSLCLAILKALTSRYGVSASILSYIKPVTQCEAEQPLTRFCKKSGIACAPIGPVVFYKVLVSTSNICITIDTIGTAN